MPQTINEQEERQLLDAAKRAADLVETGLTPDAAVEKVSVDLGFGPGKIRLMAHAYNTGRQLNQWNKTGSVLDKLASYPLADPEHVIQSIYHVPTAAEKAAAYVHPDYKQPPYWLRPPERKFVMEKVAEAAPPLEVPVGERIDALHKAYGSVQREKQAVEQYRQVVSESEDKTRQHAANLVRYFKQASYTRLPFDTVEDAAVTYFGSAVRPLLTLAYQQAGLREKRATADQLAVQTRPMCLDQAPYTYIRDCIKYAEAASLARGRLNSAQIKLASVQEESFRPFVPAGEAKQEPELWSEKAAGLISTPAMGAMMGTMLSRSLGSVPQTKDDLVNDAWTKLEDPEHANELRKIKAHAMLTQFMTDPDDPISGHDPDKVLAAYNEISQASPRVSETPALLKPILRRRLEGHTEPFEAKELTDIEKGLAQTRMGTPNTSLLSEAPDKLLG